MDTLRLEIDAIGIVSALVLVAGLVQWIRSWRRGDSKARANGCAFAFLGAALLFVTAVVGPEFFCAREVAQQTSCQHNLKRIGVALAMYAEANGDRLPVQGGLSSVAGYLEKGVVVRCPAATSPCSYAMNKHVAGICTDEVDYIQTLVAAFECDAPNARFMGDAHDMPVPARHYGTDNYAFCDGHAQSLPRPYATDPKRKPIDWLPSLTKE